jgi:hypothetical protein
MKRNLVLLLALAFLAQACGLDDRPKVTQPIQGESELPTIKAMSPLAVHPELRDRIEQAPEYVDLSPHLGVPNLAVASVYEYEGIDVKTVVVPLNSSRAMIAYLSTDDALRFIILDINGTGTAAGFTGDVTILEPSTGKVITGARYLDDAFVSEKPSEIAESELQAIDWIVFRACVATMWVRLPWFIRWACNTVIGTCVTGGLASCPSALACAAGYLGFCAAVAWR